MIAANWYLWWTQLKLTHYLLLSDENHNFLWVDGLVFSLPQSHRIYRFLWYSHYEPKISTSYCWHTMASTLHNGSLLAECHWWYLWLQSEISGDNTVSTHVEDLLVQAKPLRLTLVLSLDANLTALYVGEGSADEIITVVGTNKSEVIKVCLADSLLASLLLTWLSDMTQKRLSVQLCDGSYSWLIYTLDSVFLIVGDFLHSIHDIPVLFTIWLDPGYCNLICFVNV